MKSANADDLPLERAPIKFDLVINLEHRKGIRSDDSAKRCRCPLLAISGHSKRGRECPLSGVKQNTPQRFMFGFPWYNT
ncbi:MAG: hypothetical protein WBM06_14730, partial [Pseudolabrys sp.]